VMPSRVRASSQELASRVHTTHRADLCFTVAAVMWVPTVLATLRLTCLVRGGERRRDVLHGCTCVQIALHRYAWACSTLTEAQEGLIAEQIRKGSHPVQ
jgi:hypothetical protein